MDDSPSIRRAILWYLALLLFTSVYLTYNLRLHRADLSAPIPLLHGDSFGVLSLITSLRECGDPNRLPRVGAPGEAERYDYPLPEWGQMGLIYLLAQVTSSPFETFNWWCLLSYPLVAVCAMAALRTFGLTYPMAFVIAVLYTFLPYHTQRAFSHVLLAYYHTVPLILIPIIGIMQGKLPFFSIPDDQGRRRIALFTHTTISAIVLAAYVAATTPYYAFFACFFFLVAGCYQTLQESSWKPIVSALLSTGIICGVGFACALPFILPQRENGPNPFIAQRSANEADYYALKIPQLILPYERHRLDGLGHLTRYYNSQALNSNENHDSSLGVIGTIGFFLLLFNLLKSPGNSPLLRALAILNVAALLLGMAGGLGSIFNFAIFPQIRCYNRLCVFIAFWSLLTVGMYLDRWRLQGNRFRRLLVPLLIVTLGLLDMTTQRQAPRYSQAQERHRDWQTFVAQMEEKMPSGRMIFQLPAASYPEVGTIEKMPEYSHLGCYIYSKTLRWSYGTDRNRRWDEWHQAVARLPVPRMIESLALAGFSGVYVDRRGLPPDSTLMQELETEIGKPIVVSPSRDQVLFSLEYWSTRLRQTWGEQRWQASQEQLLNRPFLLCQQGFMVWSPSLPIQPRWAMFHSTMRLLNPGKKNRKVTLKLEWKREHPSIEAIHLHSDSLPIDQLQPLSDEPSLLSVSFEIPPGVHLLHLDAPRPIGWPARSLNAWSATRIELEVED